MKSALPPRVAAALVLTGLAAGGLARRMTVSGRPEATGPAASLAAAVASADPDKSPAAAADSPPDVASILAASPLTRVSLTAEFLATATVMDLAKLVAGLMAPGEVPSENPSLRMALVRWAELDTAGLLSAMEQPPLRHRRDVLREAVLALVELKGIAGFKLAGDRWPGLLTTAAFQFLQREPDKAEELLPWLRGSGGGLMAAEAEALAARLGGPAFMDLARRSGNTDFLKVATRAASGADAAAALQTALGFPRGDLRNSAARVAMEALAEQNAEAFKAAWPALDTDVRALLADSYVRVLVENISPVDVALESKRGIRQPFFGSRVQAAAAWARSQASGYERVAALQAAAGYAAGVGRPEEAVRLLVELGDLKSLVIGIYGMTPFNTALSSWHEKDPDAVAAWLRSEAPAAVRGRLSAILTASDPEARTDGGEAIPLAIVIKAGVSDQDWEQADAANRRILSGPAMAARAQRDPQEALTFFQGLAPEERSLESWQAAAAAKIKLDPGAASEWVRELPDGPERDAAAGPLVAYLTADGTRDGAAAFAWASAMTGEIERRRGMEAAAAAWALEDPAAARAAVAAADIPEPDRTRILKQLPP